MSASTLSSPRPQLRRFTQVDVFTDRATQGNPLAVVHDADGLSDAQMAAFARWTNLSETTFLLQPTDPQADYRVRIFTPGGELPFAGHPTLGSCHAWLAGGGLPRRPTEVVQECGVGLVKVRKQGSQQLAFAAPPLRRSGPAEPEVVQKILAALRLPEGDLLAAEWVDNGPGWVAALLPSAEQVLALRPDFAAMQGLKLGVLGPYPAGHLAQWEVRAFVPDLGVPEDPVTGSLNAGLAQWLLSSGKARSPYVASQGLAMGRAGLVSVMQDPQGVWIGGQISPCISGTVCL